MGKFFGTGPELWLNLQKAYALDVARQKEIPQRDLILPYRALEGVLPVAEVGFLV